MDSKPRRKSRKRTLRPKFELPPTSDVVFQYLFSSQGAEEGLVGFINAVNLSAGRPLIKSAVIKNPFNLADFIGDKKTVVDVKVTDENGSFYDIEMQLMPGRSFANRVLYYWSQIYSTQISESEQYTKLCPVVSIVLTRFELFPALSQVHNVFTLRSEAVPEVLFTDHAEIHTLELTERKLATVFSDVKEISQTQEPLRNWIDYLLNANQKTEVEMDKLLTRTPGLEKTHQIYTRFTRDERRRELALAREKAIRDEADHLEYAIDKGFQKGLLEGEAIGLEKGEAIGLEKGEAIGLEKGEAIGLEKGLEQGEAIGLEKGLEQGELKAKAEAVSMLLEMKFPEEFTESDREKIQRVADLNRLDELMKIAIFAASYSEFSRQI